MVFGSVARADARADSDLDVGVIPAPDAATGFSSPILSAIVDLSALVGREVGVVDLRRAGPVFAFAVAQDAILVYEAEPEAWASWFAHAQNVCLDTAHLRRIGRQALLERLDGRR